MSEEPTREELLARYAKQPLHRSYSGSQCSWTASAASTLGKDEKGAVTPAKTAQGRQSVRGPIPLHNAVSRFGDELLKREVFADLLEAKVLVEDYRGHYNHHRPHSALGYRTPAEFAMAVDLDRKVEDAGKPEELESVLTLS